MNHQVECRWGGSTHVPLIWHLVEEYVQWTKVTVTVILPSLAPVLHRPPPPRHPLSLSKLFTLWENTWEIQRLWKKTKALPLCLFLFAWETYWNWIELKGCHVLHSSHRCFGEWGQDLWVFNLCVCMCGEGSQGHTHIKALDWSSARAAHPTHAVQNTLWLNVVKIAHKYGKYGKSRGT